jgi:hypothetical protein
MNIRYLKSDEIDRQRWDDCVASAANALIYGYSWYLDLVCDRWDGLVAGNYAAVFPLPTRSKYGIRYLYQPPYTQQLGLFSCIPMSASLVDEFIDIIINKFRFAEIFLNTSSVPALHETRARSNYTLDIAPRYSRLRENYSNNLIRNLKKGESLRLQIAPHADVTRITTMFSDNRGKEIDNRNDPSYFRIRRLFHEAEHRGMARAYGTYNRTNELIAGAIFLFDRHRIIFLFSGLSEQGREAGAMPLLIDHVIREFSGSHLTLDFEGSMDTGLARFYASFGASPDPYWFLRINTLPFPLKQWIDRRKIPR